jgi:hypothetical protein
VLAAGANVIANTTSVRVGNSTVNAVATLTGLVVANSTATTTVNTAQVSVGANVIANATALYVGNSTVNAVTTQTGTSYQTAARTVVVNNSVVSVGANVIANATALYVGNSTVNSVLTQTGLTTGNSVVNTTHIAVGANVVVNTSTISVGNSTVNVQITSAGFTTSNATATFGNTTINGWANVATTLQVAANASFGANVSITNKLTANTIAVNDLTVSGNLNVTGTLTTINANNLTVTDSMIQLASDNTLGDVVDIGFFGSYEVGDGGAHEHTGMFRDASDSGVYKLFHKLDPSPAGTVDTGNTSFEFATLQAFIKTGGAGLTGFIANATNIAITANSTLAVAIVANTLSLSTPLPGTSGGTGLNTFTIEDILVANSSNGFRKLSAGAEGTILQISGGAVTYSTLDGGTY